MSYYGKTAHELHDLLINKSVTAEELTKDAFTRIDKVEDKVKAFTSFAQEQALKKAQAVDAKIAKGEEIGMLAGIPMGIKDNMATNGIPTTCSSKMLEKFVPPYDAAVVEKLAAANGVMLGKLNMDEFAMGSSTENSAFFPTKNPWDLDCVPGGSSGGAAACVAADEVVFSLGSDTGGSIRQPAAYCGVVGMKPTYGLVSRFGLIAFASSLDQIGPVTKDVADCAHVMNEITGHDHRDSTSSEYQAPDYTQFLNQEIKGMKIGLATEYLGQGLSPDVKEVIMKAVEQLTALGAEVEEVSLPHVEYALPAYYIIAPAEASSNLARYDGVRYGFRAEESTDILDMFKRTRSEGFGDEVKMRIMLGTYALSSGYYDAYYLKALKVRTLIKQDFDQAFAKYDVVIGPTAPTGAFKFGEKSQDQLSMYLSDVYTIPINLAGIPALSIPCGFDAQNMPVGLQIIGNVFDEGKLLQVAHAYEQATDFHLAKPNLNGEDK